MMTITKPEIDLFNIETITIEQICQLADYVRSSESKIIEFSAQLDETAEKAGKKNYLAIGVAMTIAKRYAEAAENLEKAADSQEKYLELAYVYRKLGNFDKALTSIDKAATSKADALVVSLEKANIYRLIKDFDSAKKQLKDCENFKKVSPQYHYILARCLESQGLYSEAIKNYNIAIEIDPAFTKALFHLAFILDLRGEEDAAIDYYKQLLSGNPGYVSALLNLTVLYEDKAKYSKALKCVEQVLKFHPNNARAILFKKDILGSETMLYDEESIKNKNQEDKMLETPITDFELSVRSRNCLKKMNINSIGDLLRISEAELLAYKNFGETSLNEIKRVLELKGMRLGMAAEDGSQSPLTLSENDNSDIEQELLDKSLDDFELSVRARKCLRHLNMNTVGSLVAKTEAELLGVKNFGITSLIEIKQLLDSVGLGLRRIE
ncbi:MAG: tetratricopeptide repeat protein [Anaerohalosphaeraceae bacterium]|nr:tetratricopeptide repeat protein [Anaerohalosphaeraceae bacterium]